MTRDVHMWHVTHDTWHMTYKMWYVAVQLHSVGFITNPQHYRSAQNSKTSNYAPNMLKSLTCGGAAKSLYPRPRPVGDKVAGEASPPQGQLA